MSLSGRCKISDRTGGAAEDRMNAPRLRLNEREVNPNPYVNFISPLKTSKDQDAANHILKAVVRAAQVKPIMKERFLLVGDLAEGKFNTVWAGLNRNHGETIWLVLRNAAGRFLPLPYILDVMCHEMAHIQQMNHGPKFQKLMAEIKADVRKLQARGYYGDGLWSDGRRLSDGIKTGGVGLSGSDFPEHICAGVSMGRPRAPRSAPSSSISGRQTKRPRKAGGKVTSDMGGGEGSRLDGKRTITSEDLLRRRSAIDKRAIALVDSGVEIKKAKRQAAAAFDKENPEFVEGKSRGKRVASKSAAELRAEAIERRLAAAKRAAQPDPAFDATDDEIDEPSDTNYDSEEDADQDQLRVQRSLDKMPQEERDYLRGGWESYIGGRTKAGDDAITSSKDDEAKDGARGSDTVASNSSDWTCVNCTMANIRDHGRCATCGSKPDGSIPPDIQQQLII